MLKLGLLWCAWCALHSLLITTALRRWLEQRGGVWLGAYRLVYVGLSMLTLLPLLWYTTSLPQQPLPTLPLWLRGPLLLYALVMFVGGLRVYDLQAFLGLRQWQCYRLGAASEQPVLNTNGLLRLVRHPWYAGGIALLWGLPDLTNVTLITRLILSAYLVIGARLEERKMRELLGAPYLEYCRNTPMFFPWRRGRCAQS